MRQRDLALRQWGGGAQEAVSFLYKRDVHEYSDGG